MKKFLVLYRMDMAEIQKMLASTSAEERKKSMGEWEVLMKKNMASFAELEGLLERRSRRRRAVQLISRTMLVVTQSYRQIARGGCSPLCRQSAFNDAKGYRGGDGDNANAGRVIQSSHVAARR